MGLPVLITIQNKNLKPVSLFWGGKERKIFCYKSVHSAQIGEEMTPICELFLHMWNDSFVCDMSNSCSACHMGWLWLVGSIKLQLSFAKEPYKRDDILQKRPVIKSILLTVATPYLCLFRVSFRWGTTWSYAWHVVFIRRWDVTVMYGATNSYVTWRIHMWRDWFICVTRLHMCHTYEPGTFIGDCYERQSHRIQVSFANGHYKRDDILPKRPIILSILLTIAHSSCVSDTFIVRRIRVCDVTDSYVT